MKDLLVKQIRELLPDIEAALLEKVEAVVNSGCISEEDYEKYLDGGESFALAKTIITSFFDERPYSSKWNDELIDLQRRIGRCV